MRARFLGLGLVWLLAACGDSEGGGGAGPGGGGGEGGGTPCAAAEITLSDGTCVSPGVQPDGCPAGSWKEEGSSEPCRAAGVQADGCEAGTRLVGGECVPAGVPPDGCDEGFEPDGARGCVAVLPPVPCGFGQMATMGETTCRAVAPCANGTFGDIPTDADAEFVDGSFVGVSDGTAQSPWTRLQDAIDAAASGDIIAIAAGAYAEDLTLDRPVRLWGRCPELVEIVGAGGPATLTLGAASAGSELRDLAITGAGVGIDLAGASGLVFDRIWVHDTGGWGIAGVDGAPSTDFTMTRSLVELTYDTAVRLYGTDATIERSVIRDTLPTPSGLGLGITVQEDEGPTLKRPHLTLRASLVERNAEVGVSVYGAEADLEGVVIRDTQPRASGKFGRGLGLQPGTVPDSGAVVTVKGSLLEGNHDSGAFVSGSSLTLHRTVIRDTLTDGLDARGYGIGIQYDPAAKLPSHVEMTECLVERSTEMGVLIAASEVRLEGVLVRDTSPTVTGTFGRGVSMQALQQLAQEGSDVEIVGSSLEDNFEVGVFLEGGHVLLEGVNVSGTQVGAEPLQGFGLAAQENPTTGELPSVTMVGSRFADNHSVGIFTGGADLDIRGTLVTGTLPVDGGFGPRFGRGASVQPGPISGTAATTTIRGSAFVANQEAGLFFAGGTATIDGVLVEDTRGTQGLSRGINVQADYGAGTGVTAEFRWSVVDGAQETGVFAAGGSITLDACVVRNVRTQESGAFGDGVGVVASSVPTVGSVQRSLVTSNQRAGVANFGAALRLEDNLLRCNVIDLVGEEVLQPFTYEDAGGNVCGCDADVACKALTSSLSPPPALETASQ